MPRGFQLRSAWAICLILLAFSARSELISQTGAHATVSGQQIAFPAAGPIDGDRFSAERAWKGLSGAVRWWWKLQLTEPREIGAILQITGDHGYVLTNAPHDYRWEYSL